MKKLFVVLAALVLIAVGFFMGTMSDNKAYALFGGGAGDAGVECENCASAVIPCEIRIGEMATQKDNIIQALSVELETFKALETFWATEVLTPAPAPCTSSCAGRNLQIM